MVYVSVCVNVYVYVHRVTLVNANVNVNALVGEQKMFDTLFETKDVDCHIMVANFVEAFWRLKQHQNACL